MGCWQFVTVKGAVTAVRTLIWLN